MHKNFVELNNFIFLTMVGLIWIYSMDCSMETFKKFSRFIWIYWSNIINLLCNVTEGMDQLKDDCINDLWLLLLTLLRMVYFLLFSNYLEIYQVTNRVFSIGHVFWNNIELHLLSVQWYPIYFVVAVDPEIEKLIENV